MRSFILHLRDATEAEVAAFLSERYPPSPGPAWVTPDADDPILYIGIYRDMNSEFEVEDWFALTAALGGEPSVSVIADVSGRHPGDDEVRAFASTLLGTFEGVAQDDYASHFWTRAEIKADSVVGSHPFFDYKSQCGTDVGCKAAEPVMEDLQAVADRIDTGVADTRTSRALVVFNPTDLALSGVAIFHADMAWPKDIPLPPVVISELGGDTVPSALTDWREAPDAKGRVDRRQVSFALRFVVRDVPPRGWRTYIAAYTDAPGPELSHDPVGESPGLVVVETLRHSGDLPSVGTMPQSEP